MPCIFLVNTFLEISYRSDVLDARKLVPSSVFFNTSILLGSNVIATCFRILLFFVTAGNDGTGRNSKTLNPAETEGALGLADSTLSTCL